MEITAKDMKVLKFEMLIDWISKYLYNLDYRYFYHGDLSTINYLSFFFSKDSEINEFEKAMVQGFRDDLYTMEEFLESLKEVNQIELAKDLKKALNKSNVTLGWACVFIFWSLMLLSVNKTNEAEKLSLICDLARILMVTDDEVMDIVQVIKVIYQETETPVFRSETVPSDAMFGGAIRHFLPNWHM